MAKGRTPVKVKLEKIKKQNLELSKGSYKPKSRNRHLLGKFDPHNERAYVMREARATVPPYDPAMVQRYDAKGKPIAP